MRNILQRIERTIEGAGGEQSFFSFWNALQEGMVFNQDAFRLVSRSDVGDSVSILHQGRTILFVSREVAKTYQGKRNVGRACQFGGQKVSQ